VKLPDFQIYLSFELANSIFRSEQIEIYTNNVLQLIYLLYGSSHLVYFRDIGRLDLGFTYITSYIIGKFPRYDFRYEG
jgi:hypothetical protein